MNTISNIKQTLGYWWLILIAGVLFSACGIYVFFRPVESYLGLSIFFTVSFLASGTSGLIFSISNSSILKGWGWYLASALLDLAIGIVLLLNPVLSIATLPLYAGFVLLTKAVFAIATSFEIKELGLPDWGWLLTLGIMGLLFSFFILFNPFAGAVTIVGWTGVAFITTGIALIIFSFRAQKMKKIFA